METAQPAVFMNLCMIRDGSKVLMLDKVKGKVTGLTFPGGHVEINEPFVDSVIREVYEETGLTAVSPKIRGIYNWTKNGTRYVGLLYLIDRFTGELKASDEGNVFWVEFDKLAEMPLINDLKELLEIFCGDVYGEFYCSPDGDGWDKKLI